MTEFAVEDVLNPRIEWANNSCYRINKKVSTPRLVVQPYTDNAELIRCNDLTDDYNIEVTDNGRFRIYIQIPDEFYAYVIGTKGWRHKQLQIETKTEITIPKRASNANIKITGATEQNVISARRRLEMICNDLRNRRKITHFILCGFVSNEIRANFLKFKELVLAEGHIDGVDESIFQNVDKIHLTLCYLVLLDDFGKDEAVNILEEIKTAVIAPLLKSSPPLIIRVKGLDYMNNDPSQVDVLYGKVQVKNHENSDILQSISDDIANYFYKKELMQQNPARVKLHATIMNTKYRKGPNAIPKHRKRKRLPFDARPILKKYSNFNFGEETLNVINFSDRCSIKCVCAL